MPNFIFLKKKVTDMQTEKLWHAFDQACVLLVYVVQSITMKMIDFGRYGAAAIGAVSVRITRENSVNLRLLHRITLLWNDYYVTDLEKTRNSW